MESEEDKFLIKPNIESITSILTLRYDYTQKSSLQKLTWQDMMPKIAEPSIEYIQNQISDYILKNLHDEKNISIALSGGVDSTLILAMIRKTLPDITINAYSIKFDQSPDETKYAKTLADRFEANHEIFYVKNYFQNLPDAIRIVKSPFWDVHWYYVASIAKKSQFLASGDGGDEIFGGYTFRYKKFLELNANANSINDTINNYLKCHERDHVDDQNDLFGKKIPFTWETIHNYLKPYFDNPLNSLEQVFLADYNGKLLYNFSLVNSRISDNFNLKSLTPLLSDKLINYGMRLEPHLKYDTSTNLGKLPLRNLLKNIAPDITISQEKQGFSVNTSSMWESYGKALAHEFLLNSYIAKDGYIDEQWILKYIDKSELSIPIINKLLGLLSLEIWYRIFVINNFDYSHL